jgi:hypothetical protein
MVGAAVTDLDERVLRALAAVWRTQAARRHFANEAFRAATTPSRVQDQRWTATVTRSAHLRELMVCESRIVMVVASSAIP